MRIARGRWLIVTVVVAAGVVGTAGATVSERGTYAEDFTFEYDDCGFPVEVAGQVEGRFRVRDGKGDDDRAFFIRDNFTYEEIHTNADTGEWVKVTGRAVFNEIKATHLEGNLFEFEAVEAGQPFRLYDADGNLVARDRGSIHHHAIFDVGDDDEVGGELVEFLEPEVHGPHPGFDDFCALITPLIGS